MPDLSRIDEIVASYQSTKSPLIYILKDVQKEFGFLSESVLTQVARVTRIPLSDIYGVATFYSLFTTKPKGQHIVRCCNNAPCWVNGSEEVLQKIKEYLEIETGETTGDGTFTLEFTSCLGLCAVAPVMMIDDQVFGNLTPEKAVAILRDYKTKGSANA
ncbi:MAG TPA: NADH-quinone oxidoreductase subunit NuoE [bacterium]|jgi:NADH-quinone oxidoreductase E subunit|nr:NADH-quinone oxidoreductase subunit NuoE [bacterium]HNT66044.1 NADH-quinone oxidoreductase subunit NuoE [bacterium]HOX85523.1 NADH-quinone oxidoreductase subunit NuoE [bacterium]HPG44682.1 NADH-quinone oxidoreductase subunit NuoE [bacterium]HPM99411.1 NADH-quinone oxidoreductase subunit NuoE [bacterium]